VQPTAQTAQRHAATELTTVLIDPFILFPPHYPKFTLQFGTFKAAFGGNFQNLKPHFTLACQGVGVAVALRM
jgi:hypothetical protein